MKYIYILKDPIDKKVRYVGMTSNPKLRLSQHLKDAKKNKKTGKTKKQKWLLDLGEKKMMPYMEIVRSINNEAVARIIEEQTVIENIDTIYNIHMPGKGSLSVENYKKTGLLKGGD
jgi:predicted GIY-YIG superfamily endonuclease